MKTAKEKSSIYPRYTHKKDLLRNKSERTIELKFQVS